MSEEFDWSYSREEQKFELPPEGDYRIRIKSAEKVVAGTGNTMIALQFEVSGSTTIVYHKIVFLRDRPEITNRNLTKFFDSFGGIQEGKFNLSSWVGQVGAAHLKKDTYNDKDKLVVHYFIAKNKQDGLAPWVEPGNKSSGGTYNPYSGNDSGFSTVEADDDSLPF